MRTSPVHYIDPSAISIVPNCNGSANDLAVTIRRGTKIKVFAPGVDRLGINPNTNSFREFTLTGRNRRLNCGNGPYTIYARLQRSEVYVTDGSAYLVFAAQSQYGPDNPYGFAGKWFDKYSYVMQDGLASQYDERGVPKVVDDPDYWWIKLGTVSEPNESSQRTVKLDTGILGTEQWNAEWTLNPDGLPLRIELECSIGGNTVGMAPYVLWGQRLDVKASLVEGWEKDAADKVRKWTITRNSGNAQADEAWNHPVADTGEETEEESEETTPTERIMTDGQITLAHTLGDSDDFAAAVAATFTITAWGEKEAEEEEEGSDEGQATEDQETQEDPEAQDSPEASDNPEEPELVPLTTAVITVYAETIDTYELELSAGAVTYNPVTQAYSPANGVAVRIRAKAQDGSLFYPNNAYITTAQLRILYWPVDEQQDEESQIPELTLTDGRGLLPVSAFAAGKSINLWLENGAQAVLARATVAYIRFGEKGDTPISIYRWYKVGLTPLKPTSTSSEEPAPAAGDATGAANVYPTDKWSKTAPNRPATGEWVLWMCGSIRHGNGAIDAWSTPVRISGDKGEPGADADDREWIYIGDTEYRSTYADATHTHPDSISQGEVSPSGTASGSDTNKQQKDWVPNGWSDTAIATNDSSNKFVYLSWRDKASDSNTWSDFHDPILWSNWGVRGIDGDGVQYVFKLYADKLTSSQEESFKPTKGTQDASGEWSANNSTADTQSGSWQDDAPSATENLPYCYCSVIKRLNGTWGNFETLGLWSRYSKDGESQPDYTQTQEAWSNDETTASVYTAPATDDTAAAGQPGSAGYPKDADWHDTTPTNTNSYAYLWRRSRKMVLQDDGSYAPETDGQGNLTTDGQWSYSRLTGTNGTSISVKGTIAVVITAAGTWPTTGVTANDLGIKQGDATIWKFNGTTWVETSTESADGDSYTVSKDCIIDLDGDGTSINTKGHLIMWSDEAHTQSSSKGWVDLGEFKGDPGTTYYTHIAWASGVTLADNEHPVPSHTPTQGQISVPNAYAVTTCHISPFDGATHMGTLIDTVAGQDETNKFCYTWQKVLGPQGPQGGRTATVYLYKRSATAVNAVNITAGTVVDGVKCLFYKFGDKKLYTDPACDAQHEFTSATTGSDGWSLTLPSGTDPIYVTAAIAYSETEYDNIGNNEWVTPALFTGEHGINSATVFLYKRAASEPTGTAASPQQTLYYNFADGKLYATSALTTEATTELNGWSLAMPATDGNPCYVIQAVALSTEPYDAIKVVPAQSKNDWSSVRKMVENGADGNGIVSIARTFAISSIGTTASETTEPTHQGSWTVNSPAVTEQYPYLWAKEEVVFTDTTKNTTKYYCIGAKGDPGIDAQDFEWVYVLTTTETPPTIVAGSGTDYWKQDDFKPLAQVSSGRIKGNGGTEASAGSPVQCTDDPQGVNDTWKFEWEMKRTKGAAVNGRREWNNYTPGEAMTLHNNYAETAFVIDISNDNDQFGTDSNGVILPDQQVRSTVISMYFGSQAQELNADNASTPGVQAELTYEDGTSVPSTVATVSYGRNSSDHTKGNVVVAIGNPATQGTHVSFPSYHSGLKVHITATCAMGSKSIDFPIQQVKSGAPGVSPTIYQLNPTNKDFVFNRNASNELYPASRSTVVNALKTTGNTTIDAILSDNLTFTWGFDESSTQQGSGTVGDSTGTPPHNQISISNTQANAHYQVWVQLSTGDRETLPIVKDGANGSAGKDAQYIYLKGSARDVANGILTQVPPVVNVNGGTNLIATARRGLNLVTLNRQTLAVVESISGYDTYGEAAQSPDIVNNGIQLLISKLGDIKNGVSPYADTDVFVCLVSCDAIGWTHGTYNLITALQEFGMGDLPYTQPGRYPFLFIGHKNLGKGNGITRMNPVGSYLNAVELSAYVANGALTVKDGADGTDGDDGWSCKAEPDNVFIEQDYDANDQIVFTPQTVEFKVMKGNNPMTVSSLAVPSELVSTRSLSDLSAEFNAAEGTGANDNKVIVSRPKTHGDPAEYYTKGSFTVIVNAVDPSDDTKTASFTVTVPCFAQMLGKRIKEAKGDMERDVATKLTYGIDPTSQEPYTLQAIGTYMSSASGKIDSVAETVTTLSAGANPANLFGFTKGTQLFDSPWKVLPYIQGYGIEVYNVIAASDVYAVRGCVNNIGMNGQEGTYVFSMEIKASQVVTSGTFKEMFTINPCSVGNVLCKRVIEGMTTINNAVYYEPSTEWKRVAFTVELTRTSLDTDFDNRMVSRNGYIDIVSNVTSSSQNAVYLQEVYNSQISAYEWKYRGSFSGSPTRLFIRKLQIERATVPSMFGICDEDDKYAATHNHEYVETDTDPVIKLDDTPKWSALPTAAYPGYGFGPSGETWNGMAVYKNAQPLTDSNGKVSDNYRIMQLVCNHLKLTANTPYTLSFWAKTSEANAKMRSHLACGNVGGNAYEQHSSLDSTVSARTDVNGYTDIWMETTWRKYYIHFYAQNTVDDAWADLRITTADNLPANCIFSVCGMKLEKGYITSYDRKDYETVFRQTSRSIDMSVLVNSVKKAGIELTTNQDGDVTDGIMKLIANKVNFYDPTGENLNPKVWIDPSTGALHAVDGEFEGTVKADNFFHGVCIVGKEKYYYCTQDFVDWYDDPDEYPWITNFTLGAYYTLSQIRELSNGEVGSGGHGMIACTYMADIVICPNLYNNTAPRYVTLPRAEDFEGKIVEVIDNAYTNGQAIGDIVVNAVDGGEFGGGIWSSGVTRLGTSATIPPEGRCRFYSIYDQNQWWWLKLD